MEAQTAIALATLSQQAEKLQRALDFLRRNAEAPGLAAAVLATSNRVMNGDFRVNQRGYASGSPCEGFGFDRWLLEDLGGTNYNSNPSFESASTGWSNINGGSQARSSTQKRTGTYSLAVTRSGSGDDYVTKTISGLTAGAWYRVSGWFYLSAAGASYESRLMGAVGGTIAWAPPDSSRVGRWVYRTVMVQASGTSITLRVYAITGATVYVDDLSVSLAPTLSYSSTPQGCTVTIGATATLRQTIERTDVAAGDYTLSWAGTATARVYNYAASATPPTFASGPLTVSLDGLDDVVIEFSNGTLTQVNLTPGPRAFPFIGRRFADELALCTQRLRGQVATSASGHVTVTYSKPFAAPPVLVVTALRSVSNVVVVDLLPGSLGAASFQVATYIAGGGISANSVSWIAEGIPAGP